MKKLNKVLLHTVLIIISIIFITPLLWMVISTTNTSTEIIGGKILPGNQFLININNAIFNTAFISSFINSTIIAIITTVLSLFLASIAAYSFQIYGNYKSEIVYNIIIGSLMIPFAALMIPLYSLIVKIGLLDTYASVILAGGASVLLLFFFRQALKNFPVEMIHAARIDGASEIKIFFFIVVPSMKATYAAACIVSFMGSWNSYLWPLLVLKSSDVKTLPLTISSMGSMLVADYGSQMVVITLSTIPMLIIFITLQKYFVEGMIGNSK